jgi:hypothetical protein
LNGLWRARAPEHATWDAYFFIAIFPNGEWCKVHAFSGGPRYCTSALEGIDGEAQEVVLLGRSHAVERHRSPPRDVSVSGSGEVRAPRLEARVEAADPFFWIKVPRFLSYFSATGAARVTVDGVARDAFGVLEHAWGGSIPVNLEHASPRRWHWDVVSLGGTRFFAGLGVGPLLLGAHGAARTSEGASLSRVSRLRIRVHEWSELPDREVPRRWSGTMVARDGTLHYDARATTPASPELAGGGFLGFTWEGTFRDAAAAGAGFCEYRGP